MSKRTWHEAAVVGIAVAVALLGFFFGERLAYFGQLGDEKLYYFIARDFDQAVFGKHLNDYYVQRILPSGIVHYTLQILGRPADVFNVLIVYGICNCLLLTLTAWLWCATARELKLSVSGLWLGFIALFGNFAVLKYIPYIQVTTDAYAYALGMAMMYFYLKDWMWAIAGTTLIGAFVWPAVIYIGGVLILFGRDSGPAEGVAQAASKRAPFFLPEIIAGGIAAGAIWEFAQILFRIRIGNLFAQGIFSTGANHPLENVIYVSMAITLVYIFITVRVFLNDARFFDVEYYRRKASLLRIMVAGSVYVGIKAVIGHWAGLKNSFPADYLVFNMLAASIIQPGNFLVAHVVYFGPAVLFFFFFGRAFADAVRSYGIGFTLAMVLVAAQSIHGESRTLMNFYPLAVAILIKAANDRPWPAWQVIFVGVLSVLCSKVWLRIHPAPWGKDPFAFPNQFYFMNFGPHMSHAMYALQGMAVLAAGLILYFTIVRTTRRAG